MKARSNYWVESTAAGNRNLFMFEHRDVCVSAEGRLIWYYILLMKSPDRMFCLVNEELDTKQH